MGDMVPNPDFVQQFYSLKGNLVGERKKNFSTILRSVSAAGQVEVFLDGLAPKNYLESLLRLDALIYFRKTQQMLELLRQGNEVFISKILKQKWFVREAFREYSAEYLVNEFLPCLSYAVRKKFIKILMQTIEDQWKVDELFSAYYERYGLSLASNLLHLCSANKIKSILEREEVKLQPNQVKHLFDKKPDSFKRYLIYHNNTFSGRYQEKKVTEYIANKDPKMLLDLLEDCHLNCSRLGRRQSKRIFGLVQNDVINDFHKYNRLLTSSVLVKRLGQNFAKVYYEIFPKSIGDLNFYSEHFTLLKHYPRLKRWQLFYDTSTRKLSLANLENVLGQLKDERELQLLTPGNEIIWKWAEVQYNISEQDRYLKFYPASKSIPIIREKINVTSDISKRENLVMLLLGTCAYNKDLNALERIMKYIGYRHKNEQPHFHHIVLAELATKFNLKDFTESLWGLVNDVLKVLRVKKEFSLWRYSLYSKAYIEFLFLNNKDHSEALKEFINDVIPEKYFQRWNLKDPKLERKILVEIVKVALPIIETTDDALNHKDRLVDTIASFNIEYPEHQIKLSSFPELHRIVLLSFNSNGPYDDLQRNIIRVFLYCHAIVGPDSLESIDDDRIIQVIKQSVLESSHFYLLDYFESMMEKKSRSSFEETLVNTYFEVIFDKFPEVRIVNWFLKHEPEKVTSWYPKIINALHGIDGTVNCKVVKYLSHFNYDTQLCELLKPKLASENHDDKGTFMSILRRLLPTEDYIALVTQYFLPEKEKLDLTDEKMMALYHVQCKVSQSLHRVEEPYKMLPVVMKFAIGDYLQSSIPCLYGVFYKSPEKLLPKCLDDLSKRALSARKHAVFLTCELLDQKSVVAALTGTKHEQVSSQKHVFSATLKYFQRNPLPELLDLLMANMSSIDKHDTEGLESLLAAKVPKKYKVQYLERCWRFYESLKESQVKITVYLNGILDKILSSDTLLLELSSSFVREIIQNYFIERREDLHRIMNFTVAVLQKRNTDREKNFELTFRRVPALSRRERRVFFKSLTDTLSLSTEVKTLIERYWNQHFSTIDSFWEHIYLKLYLGDGSAGHTIEVLDGILDKFGPFAFQVFQDVFQHYMSIRYQDSREKLRFCQELLQQRDSDSMCLLALHGAGIYREDDETKNIARNIFEAIKKIDRPIIQVYCDKYLMERE